MNLELKMQKGDDTFTKKCVNGEQFVSLLNRYAMQGYNLVTPTASKAYAIKQDVLKARLKTNGGIPTAKDLKDGLVVLLVENIEASKDILKVAFPNRDRYTCSVGDLIMKSWYSFGYCSASTHEIETQYKDACDIFPDTAFNTSIGLAKKSSFESIIIHGPLSFKSQERLERARLMRDEVLNSKSQEQQASNSIVVTKEDLYSLKPKAGITQEDIEKEILEFFKLPSESIEQYLLTEKECFSKQEIDPCVKQQAATNPFPIDDLKTQLESLKPKAGLTQEDIDFRERQEIINQTIKLANNIGLVLEKDASKKLLDFISPSKNTNIPSSDTKYRTADEVEANTVKEVVAGTLKAMEPVDHKIMQYPLTEKECFPKTTFEVGKAYEHVSGKQMFLCSVIADAFNNVFFIAQQGYVPDEALKKCRFYSVALKSPTFNWKEITKESFINCLDKK